MKNKEEIEQLAEKFYNKSTSDFENYILNIGFVDGYNQCQEDMADKKYTEEDMFKCWEACRRFERPISEGYAPNFNEFINSLNKQD
ncbi:MAG: hypothetical protein RIR01_1951 [Bacteroidota bacterium]|jgi:hypothetical protein